MVIKIPVMLNSFSPAGYGKTVSLVENNLIAEVAGLGGVVSGELVWFVSRGIAGHVMELRRNTAVVVIPDNNRTCISLGDLVIATGRNGGVSHVGIAGYIKYNQFVTIRLVG